MMRKAAMLCAAIATALLAGCATVPGSAGTEPTSMGRPLADQSPAGEAETRARNHVDLAMAYFELGRFDVALDEAQVAMNNVAGYAPAYHVTGLVYMMLGETAAARANFEQALRAAPGDPDFNNSYGWFLCTQGQEREGLTRLSAAARNPYNRYAARPLTNAGLCHLRLNEMAAAEQQFLRALELDPQSGQAMLQLAEIAYRRGDYDLARNRLVRLHQQMSPTAESVWLGLRTERRLGNREAAASYESQLRGRFSDSPEFQSLMQGKYE